MSDTVPEERKDDAISIEDLRKMMEDANAGRAEAERRYQEEQGRRQRVERERDELAGHAGNAAQQKFQVEMAATEGVAASAAAELDRAEEAYAAARDSGDAKAEARAVRAMNEAMLRQTEARNRKAWLENNREHLTRTPQVQKSDDPYDAHVKDLRPGERRFLESRPQFLTDERYRKKVFAASAVAEAEGLTRDSQAYLDKIAEIVDGKRAEVADDDPPPPRRERSVPSDVAPTRRAAPGGSTGGRVIVDLTQGEKDAADDLYGHPQAVMYIQDPAERYKHYFENKQRMAARSAG